MSNARQYFGVVGIGGRKANADTVYGRFNATWLPAAHNKQCTIIDEDGNVVGHAFLEIREPKSRGLGDTVEKVTKALGVKPCKGCKKRIDHLNQLIPYNNAD